MTIDTILLLTLGTVMLSSFVQSVTGFGFGLVAMALLPLFLTFKEAYFILIIPNMVLCAANFWANRRHYQWRQGLALAIGSCLAVPLGFYLMTQMNSAILMRSLGVLICIFAGSELLMTKSRPLRVPESFGAPMGLVSGTLSGAFNMGGPPAIAYVYSQTWTKEHIVALLQLVFGLSSVIRLGLMKGVGMVSPQLLRMSLLAIAPLLLATWLGNRLLRKIPREHLRIAVFVLLFAIGAKYVLKL